MPWILVGCSEFGLDPIDDPEPPPDLVVVEESFVQQPLPTLDVLFVVDASTSMTQELAALGEGVQGLVAALDDVGVGWQLGVVTAGSRIGGDGPSNLGLLRGHPWVMTSQTPDVDAAFAAALPPPSVLAGEGGIAAAIAALDEADGGQNLGFRRQGAALVVVFISDGDDASDELLDGPPAQALAEAFQAEEQRYGAPARASALVGDLPAGCTSSLGTARPAPRYHQVVADSGGVVGSVCSLDFAPVLAGVAEGAVAYPTRFPLAQLPATDDVQVEIDGEPAQGWAIEALGAGAVLAFDEAPRPAVVIDIRYVVSNTSAGAPTREASSTDPSGVAETPL
jgi:hypothetical protein